MRLEKLIELAEANGLDVERLSEGPYEVALVTVVDGPAGWEAEQLAMFTGTIPEGEMDCELVVGELNAVLYACSKPAHHVPELAGFCDAIILTKRLKTQLYEEAGKVCGEDWRILAHAESWIEDQATQYRKGE